MRQANLCNSAWDLKFLNCWKSSIKALILRHNFTRLSFTVGIAPLCDGWQNLVIRTCGQPGYTATCSQSWLRNSKNFNSFAWSLELRFTWWSNLNWQIGCDRMQQLLESPGSFDAPWLHAATKTQQEWLEVFPLRFLNFLDNSSVLPDRH